MGQPRARIASRRGKLGVYWRDVLGRRHFVVCEDDKERQDLLDKLNLATMAEATTLSGYSHAWLERVRSRSAKGTYESYERIVRKHVRPTPLGQTKLLEIRRRHCMDWVAAQANISAKRTAGLRAAVLRNMLADAVRDELIPANPATEIIRSLRLPMKSKDVPGIDARDAGKLLDILSGSEAFAQVVLMIHTGLRRGEAFGLPWRAVDFDLCSARIMQQMHLDGRVETLKTEKSHRSVDLAAPLVEMMRVWRRQQQEEALRLGIKPTEYVLGVEPPEVRRAYNRAQLALAKAAKRVGIPGHVTHHTLRHAYASIQLSTGQDLVYVSQQLGHASVSITADLYGCHLRKRDHAAADNLASLISVKRVGLVRRR